MHFHKTQSYTRKALLGFALATEHGRGLPEKYKSIKNAPATGRSIASLLNRIGWWQGYVGGVSVGVSGRSFMFTLFCSCLKSKACNESKDVDMDILPLTNWQNYLKRLSAMAGM